MNDFIHSHLDEIKKNNILHPELELRVLLSHCSIQNEEIFLNNFNVNKININKFKSAFQRRLNHEPISKIFNTKEFWSLNFFVNIGFGFLFFLLITTSSDYKIFDRINGINEFSNEFKKDLKETSNIVVSDRLMYSNLAYQYKNEQFKLFMPLSFSQKITKHFQIKSSLKKEMHSSFLFIGDPSEISYLENIPNIRLLKETHLKFTSSPIRIYEVTF